MNNEQETPELDGMTFDGVSYTGDRLRRILFVSSEINRIKEKAINSYCSWLAVIVAFTIIIPTEAVAVTPYWGIVILIEAWVRHRKLNKLKATITERYEQEM